jgi:hypothetical protein
VQKLQIDSFIIQKKSFICKMKNLERYKDSIPKVLGFNELSCYIKLMGYLGGAEARR